METRATRPLKAIESIRGAMDVFDAFYDSTSRQETDDAVRNAISTIMRSKGDWGTPKGLELVATKLIDVVVQSLGQTTAMTGPEVAQLILGILGTNPQEVDSTMKLKILSDRLERLVSEAADAARLLPAKQTEEWGSHDMVYYREMDGWEVTLGYFPEYLRPRVIYGRVGVSPQISKGLAFSARYHLTKLQLVAEEDEDDLALVRFMKSRELDRLASAYGISYELPPLGGSSRPQTHSAMGGYNVMLASLEKDLRSSPYSAEKLLNAISGVNVFKEDEGISIHMMVDYPRGHPDIGQNLTLAFGVDFFKLSRQEWQDFKKVPPLAIAALEPLMDQKQL
jgi:hypothetical protein